MEEKVEDAKIPVVVGEIFELLEEKRVKCVINIEKRFEEYYKHNRLIYHKYRSNLVKITYPTNLSVIYSFKTKENMRNFFNYWLFYDYSNPNWETDGVNILNVLVKLENAYLFKSDWKNFNYWWKQKVIEQNLAYMYKKDHLYLWDIEYQSNKLFQILRGMNFNSYKMKVNELDESLKTWKSEVLKQAERKIEALELVSKFGKKLMNVKHFNDKWKAYRNEWLDLKIHYGVKDGYSILKSKYPKDTNLKKTSPLSFNRAMNKWYRNH